MAGRLRSSLTTAALLGPALLFLTLTLCVPIGLMLWRSVDDPIVRDALPLTLDALRNWNPDQPPPEAAYRAAVRDLARLPPDAAGDVARRLNIETPGLRTAFLAAANGITGDPPDARAALVAANKHWGEPAIWRAIWAARGQITARFLLSAVDIEQHEDGSLAWRPADRAIYREILIRTFMVSGLVTAACFVVGLPLSLYLAALEQRMARRALLLIMMPLWTSVLVRAMAWILVLGSNGPVNAALVGAGIVAHPLALVFNRFSVIVTMVHVLLPFMVLPLTDALRRVPRNQLWAAGSLGAGPWTVLRRIYLPQARTGMWAGIILVFASGAGYYITPALVGGGSDEMIGAIVQQAALRDGNVQFAAALGVVFLALFLAMVAGLAALLRPRPVHGRGLARV